MPYATLPPTTHLPGTGIALGLESGRNPALWRIRWSIGTLLGVVALLLIVAVMALVVSSGGDALFLVLLAVVGVVLVWRLYTRNASIGARLLKYPDPTARVGVVGPEAELGRLLRLPLLRDEAFEPLVIKLGPPWFVYPAAILATLVVGVPALIVAIRFGGNAASRAHLVMLLVPAAVLTFSAIFPRYARLVPGRMDILQGSFLGRRLRLKQSYDLRTPAVLVDLNDRCLLLIHPGGRTQVVHLPAEKERNALVPQILRAAISSAHAAPLPDDALVG